MVQFCFCFYSHREILSNLNFILSEIDKKISEICSKSPNSNTLIKKIHERGFNEESDLGIDLKSFSNSTRTNQNRK